MNARVAVAGDGVLAEFVYRQLSGSDTVIRLADIVAADIPKSIELVLSLHDDRQSADDVQVEERMRLAGVSWLRGFIASGEGIVGPLVRPDRPGCSQCADTRRLTAGHDPSEDDEAASAVGLWHVANLVAAESQRVLQGRRAYTQDHMYLVNLKTLKISRHFFLPDPVCTVCSDGLPEDSMEAARIILEPRIKIHPDRYRCRSLDDLKHVLMKDYVDARTGLLNGKMVDFISPFAMVNVNLPSFLMGDEVAGGRSHSYEESELTAILEGLERFCGQVPRGKRTAVYDCFNNLAGQALDPVTVGLYSNEQYAQPDFPFEAYHPDLPLDWIWGYSFRQARPILVPESLVYFSSGYGGGIVQEGSNGCALGGSLEEAIFYGILEVVERDSFLMTWYGKLPIPRLDPGSARDPELRLMIDRVRAVAGYEVHLFNMTTENGIPGIWALAKNANPDKFNFICAAGAHVDPIRAAKSAIHELSGMIAYLQAKYESDREEIVKMAHDPALVRQMEHHSLLYGLPQAEERLSFLLEGSRPSRSFEEEFRPKAGHADLTDDLLEMIRKFRKLNLDVIVVNQSSPETMRNNLYGVKVIIPGMLPMSFGHHLTRIQGLPRLFRVPVQLGYVKEPMAYTELNSHPHPFF